MAQLIELGSGTANHRTIHFRLFTSDGTSPDTGASADSVIVARGSATTFTPNALVVAVHAAQGMYSIQLTQSDVSNLGQHAVYHTQGAFPQHVANFCVVNSNPYSTQSNVDSNVSLWRGTAPNALVSGRVDSSTGAMAANVITAASINADAITAAKIADGAIDAATFAAGAINAAAIATDAIDADAIAANAFTGDALASDFSVLLKPATHTGAVIPTVTAVTNLVDSNATVTVMNSGVITNAAFAADSISSDKIADNALGAEHFADNAFSTHSIGLVAATHPGVTIPTVTDVTNAVTTGTISANAITNAAFAADSISSDKIADNALGTEHFADNAFSSHSIGIVAANQPGVSIPLVAVVTDVTNLVGSNATVTVMNANVITNAAFAADSISSDKIADNALGAEHFADNAFSTHSIGIVAANQPGVTIPTVTAITDAVTVGTNNDKTGYSMAAGGIVAASFGASAIDAAALATDAGQEIADRMLSRAIAGGADSGRTVGEALMALRNRVLIGASTITVYQADDTTAAWTASYTTAAFPLSGYNPA